MSDSNAPASPLPVEIQATLHKVGQLLREAHHLGPDAQAQLAELVDELGTAIGSASVTPEEAAHLAAGAEKLMQSLHERHDTGVVSAARDRLEGAAAAIEARAPAVAGITRRILDALSGIGI
jgi:hypothetical protein